MANVHKKLPDLPILDSVGTLFKEHADAVDNKEIYECLLSNTWKPSFAVIGIRGPPNDLVQAGNVVYKDLTYRISVRTAPNHDC